MDIDGHDVNVYLNPDNLNRDIKRKKLNKISMMDFSQHGNIVKYPISLSRQIWVYPKIQLAFGIMVDGDKGKIFNYLVKILNELLADPDRTTRVKPFLNIFFDEERLTLSFDTREEIPMWTMQIPESLENQMEKRYKQIYDDLSKDCSENDTIREVMKKTGKSKEEIYRNAVEVFKEEEWFVHYLEKLKDNIKWSL